MATAMSGPDVRETSGMTTRLILAYVRRTAGEAAVKRVYEQADVPESLAHLEDEHGWSSYRTKVALLEAAAAVLEDPEAPRRIGELTLDESVGSTVKVVVSLAGSPSQALRRVDRLVGKFSTVARMRPLTVEKGYGVVGYRMLDGYTPHAVNCAFNLGVLSQLPALFGLSAGTVAHPRCQAGGASECQYELTWQPRPWWRRRRTRRASGIEVRAVHGQLEALQDTVADLVSLQDLDEVLARVADRATTAVRASRYLLAVRLDGEAQPRIHNDGIEVQAAQAMGKRLLDSGALALPGTDAVIADVVSSRRCYGYLAALLPTGQGLCAEEQDLLDAYARLAAAALDSATALLAARERGQTAEVLLGLATDLAGAETVPEVARVAAQAVPSVIGAPRGALFLYDPDERHLVLGAHAGWPAEIAEMLETLVIREQDTSEVHRLADSGHPSIYTADHHDPFVTEVLRRLGTRAVVAVPIVAAGRYHGVLYANWAEDHVLPVLDDALFARAEGLAHHVGTTLGRAQLLAQVSHQATHDALTGLPNRTLFEDRVGRALATWKRTGHQFGLLFVDLDRFKAINDSLGHAAGDELLREAGGRLQSVVRDSDSVARVGGDEFMVLLDNVGVSRDAEVVAGKIVEVFAEAFHVAGRDVHTTASVGIAFPDDPEASVSQLLRLADGAMYDAKRGGRNGWCWSTGAATDALERMSLTADLRRAIATGQLELHYQPQISASGGLAGVEALVRWSHPQRGLLGPGVFLPLAEEAGLMVALDLAVLRMAIDQADRWRRAGLPALRLAVNISAGTFCNSSLLTTTVSALAASGYPPHLIEFELTEHEQVPDFERARVIATALDELGVGVVIDDVGRGFASLSWLHELPVRRMKLDRSFVSEVETSHAAAELTTGLIALGRRLGCSVLAEGVETAGQIDYVLEHGCDEVQGFYYARPLPPADLVAWLEDYALVRA